MDVKLLLGGLALAGVGMGAYALLNRSAATNGPSPGTSQPAPALPSPSSPTTPPIADAGERYCAQVVTKCADGTWAGTPCDCESRGGVAPRDPALTLNDPQPEILVLTQSPTNSVVEKVISKGIMPTLYSDIYDSHEAWAADRNWDI